MKHILQQGHHFCVRLKSNVRITKAFNQLDTQEAILPFKLIKGDTGQAQLMRLIRYQIGRKTYVLMTSLLKSQDASHAELKDLYHQRWEIEESFKVKKCRIKIEEVRGLTPEIVRQDFHAKIFAECLTAALMLGAEPAIKEYSDGCKRTYQISFTQALAKMKNTLVLLFLRPQITALVDQLLSLFTKSLIAKVSGRKFKRKHQGKNASKIQTNSMAYTWNR